MNSVSFAHATQNNSEAVQSLMIAATQESPEAFSFTSDELQSNTALWWTFYLQPYFDDKKGKLFIVNADDAIVGMGGVQYQNKIKQNHIAFIYWFFLQKDFRGYGYGKKLLETLLEDIYAHKAIKKISLQVTSSQSNAIKLYESYGFNKTGVLKQELFLKPHYYDVFIYEKYL